MLSGDIASRAGTPQNLSCLLAQGYLARVLARLELSSDAAPTMGCSLCSLQKPEEQYRLLYEVCQV